MSRSILVVDDDQDISLMLKDRLEFLGFAASMASNGREGMASLEKMGIDGMLLDMQMPVMDGLTMLKQVRERYPILPVIVMSGEPNTEKLIQAIAQGANDYLLKPIDPNQLAKKCCTIFGAS